ncbi:MAG: hypothetical protein FWH27_02350 [Planctomycetaceae bacterium]|nr:hypothetical protein [Planctomycetaceae bacterium]
MISYNSKHLFCTFVVFTLLSGLCPAQEQEFRFEKDIVDYEKKDKKDISLSLTDVTSSNDTSPEYSILFIGNSFTYWNDMPDMLSSLITAAGDSANVTSVTAGGYDLLRFSNAADPHGARVNSALTSQRYDYVITNELSWRPIIAPELFYDGVRQLKPKIDANGAETILYQTWGKKEGKPFLSDNGLTTASMESKVRAAYETIAEELGLRVSYVGVAFTDVYTNHPSISLYDASDGHHPSREGSYLAACVHFATIYGKTPVDNAYTAGIPAATAKILQTAAYNAVFNTPKLDCSSVASPRSSAERPLLDGPGNWSGLAGGNSSIEVTSQNPLVATVTVGGGSEGFPLLKLNLPASEDWRGYTTIAFEIKLESDDPGPRDGGKEIAFCLYDWGLRHDYLDGNPCVQQLVTRYGVKSGDWHDASVDLRPSVRGRVAGLDIYLYDMPYNYPHTFKISFRNLRLVGPDGDQIVFDGESFPEQSLQGNAGNTVGSISTEDGLSLALGDGGGITQLQMGKQLFGSGENQVSGILLRDAKTDSPPVMVGGTIVQQDGTLHQSADLRGMNLKLAAIYRADKCRILIDGHVESTSADDRAVTVYVALPVTPGDWNWHQSLSRTTKPFEEMKKLPQLEDGFCPEPLAVLANVANDCGLALIMDQKFPVVYRFLVNPREKLVYAAFDFALLNQDNAQGISQRKADFHLELARTDPAWGFRSGLDKLYSLHPENFIDRVGYGGGWEYFGSAKNQLTEQENLASGCRFDWNADSDNPARWEWNHENGIKNLIYIEPDFLQFSMGDFAKPTRADTQTRLKKLTANDNAEWEKFLKLHYSRAFNCNPYPKSATQRPFLDDLMSSIAISGMYANDGQPILGIGYRPDWIGDSGFGAMIPANLAPGIPGGRGATTLEHCLGALYNEILTSGLSHPDGFGLDCFMAVPHDYRRENFRYMNTPLSFDFKSKAPLVPCGFGSIEWLKELRKRYADTNGLIMANAFGPMIFAAPYLDIFGIENTQVLFPDQIRIIAGPKRPVTFLSYHPPAREVLDYHLIWGIYPGRNTPPEILTQMVPVLDELYQAGWQPVTGARISPGHVHVERFGDHSDKYVYLAIYNPEHEKVTVTLSLDMERLGLRTQVETIYNGSEIFSINNKECVVNLDSKQTIIIKLR